MVILLVWGRDRLLSCVWKVALAELSKGGGGDVFENEMVEGLEHVRVRSTTDVRGLGIPAR